VCASCASTGLCGGQRVTAVPTATLNIKEYLQPRNFSREKSYSRKEAGSRPKRLLGKAADTDEETGICSLWDRRGTGSSISGKIFRITSGRSRWQQGLVATCQDSSHEAKC
jgi:hypothetical protein